VAWEWVAPVSSASGAVIVGGIGIISTLMLSRRNAEQAEKIAELNTNHTEKLAREARRHDRLEAAYVDLLVFAQRAGAWAEAFRPLKEDDPEAAPLPPKEEWQQVQARADAYGSPELRHVFRWYLLILREIDFADRKIAKRHADSKRNPDQDARAAASAEAGELLEKLIREQIPAEQEKRKELIARVAEELLPT
jgi:hypothetical protein